MALLRLSLCVGGVYSMFLLWAIAQERLSVPFAATDGTSPAKLTSALFVSIAQSFLSSLSALVYILIRRNPKHTFAQSLGLVPPPTTKPTSNGSATSNGHATSNGNATANGKTLSNGNAPSYEKPTSNAGSTPARFSTSALIHLYLRTAIYITLAAPFGFAALSHISYPALVLGKSCKLVPVLLMNVLLYRRKFSPHKYLVVTMVTAGITLFMFYGPKKPGKSSRGGGGDSLIGTAYLLINLILDGATNSTQDEIFSRYKHLTGQQMMFFINIFCTLINTLLLVVPLPSVPVFHPTSGSDLAYVWQFISTHPDVVRPLLQFALTGALGQLFIFETLQHFGSLTLVTITLTRKLFTMLLSVVVYKHRLTPGQWLGAGVVFAGIAVEAGVKRKEVHAKRVIQEKEKARIKTL